jgi:spore germination cell wall hydrolase CwlJ-like protein
MSAAALRIRAINPPADNRRTLGWLAGIILLVSLLTSNMVWAQFFDLVGAQDTQFSDMPPASSLSPREMETLIQLTETSGPMTDITPDEAITRNEAIPFTHNPVASAKPFFAPNRDTGTGLTALRCLTQAVYFEAGFEPLAGRRAVAQVVLNRVMHPAFPNSVCGVVYQGVNRPVCQFSFTCDGSLNRHPNPAAWAEAEGVAQDALNGHVETSVGYSTHYHANYVSPYWAPKLVKIARIGAHIFYRWPGGWGMPGAFSGHYSGSEAIPAIMPRSLVAKRNTDPSGHVRGLSEDRIAPDVVTDRHADSDVGGRLDMSKGWGLGSMEPEEIDRASSILARQQAGEYDLRKSGSGS